MKSEGIESLDFFYHKHRPTVQKDGNKYEILTIDLTEDDDIELTVIKVYPSYEHKLTYLTVDSTWKKTSVNHIANIIKKEINKLYE
jgi:hypothetical protein